VEEALHSSNQFRRKTLSVIAQHNNQQWYVDTSNNIAIQITALFMFLSCRLWVCYKHSRCHYEAYFYYASLYCIVHKWELL